MFQVGCIDRIERQDGFLEVVKRFCRIAQEGVDLVEEVKVARGGQFEDDERIVVRDGCLAAVDAYCSAAGLAYDARCSADSCGCCPGAELERTFLAFLFLNVKADFAFLHVGRDLLVPFEREEFFEHDEGLFFYGNGAAVGEVYNSLRFNFGTDFAMAGIARSNAVNMTKNLKYREKDMLLTSPCC